MNAVQLWPRMREPGWSPRLRYGGPGMEVNRMGKRTCEHPDGCPLPYYYGGWCRMHAERVRRHGDPGPAGRLKAEYVKGGRPRSRSVRPSSLRRFPMSLILSFRTISQGPIGTPCWVTDRYVRRGYSSVSRYGRPIALHRASYEYFKGPIPDGYEVDHLCHNVDTNCPGGSECPHRRCGNPLHLEAVPRSINRDRAVARRRQAQFI
jgi:hypothetical protein